MYNLGDITFPSQYNNVATTVAWNTSFTDCSERDHGFAVHIVDSVYNYANSLLENFSGDTKNVIKFLQNNCFFSNYIRECKRVSLSDRQQYYCFIIKQLNVINKNVTCNSCKRKKPARSSCIFSLQLC